MGRARLPAGSVIETAIELIDADGFEALSLSAVAAALDVRPSALYNHIDSLDALRGQLAATATERLAAAISDAAMGVAGLAALRAVTDAYRAFAADHPGQYSALLRSSPGAAGLADANARLHDVFVRIYRGAGVPGPDADQAARRTRHAVHGYVTLQHSGALADDAEFEHLIDGLRTALPDGA